MSPWMRVVILTLSLTCVSAVTEDIELDFRANASDKVLNDLEVEIGATKHFTLQASAAFDTGVDLYFVYENGTTANGSALISVRVSPASTVDDRTVWLLEASGTGPGHVTLVLDQVTAQGENYSYSISKAFVRFQVYHSQPLNVVSDVIGWMYFAAWSVSFYPQAYLNWKRKSVVGLNFDFMALNLAGFLCYSAYNIGLFWIPAVKEEFQAANPHDILPVEVNDVVFSIHAVVLTMVCIIQALIYERGGQKVSMTARIILALCSVAVIIVIIIALVPSVPKFNWFEMVYALSYVKLGITIIKYIPQAWMNFRRKSTVGWSIANVLLDFTGGTGSIIQMFILAYNFNDWKSIFLNPVKFWLGALSIFFDVIFIVQHYGLYRNSRQTSYSLQKDEPDDHP